MESKISITSRIFAALVAGYLFANALGVFLSFALPIESANAFMGANLFSFLFWGLAILWSFAARSAKRVWLGLVLPTLVFSAVAFVLTLGVAQ